MFPSAAGATQTLREGRAACPKELPTMDFGIRYDPEDGKLKYFEWTYDLDMQDMNMEDIDYSNGAGN